MLSAESKLYKIVFSGTGPGLFFMAFGAIILLTAIFAGKAGVEKQVYDRTQRELQEIKQYIMEVELME